jgi:hypothetical protein
MNMEMEVSTPVMIRGLVNKGGSAYLKEGVKIF